MIMVSPPITLIFYSVFIRVIAETKNTLRICGDGIKVYENNLKLQTHISSKYLTNHLIQIFRYIQIIGILEYLKCKYLTQILCAVIILCMLRFIYTIYLHDSIYNANVNMNSSHHNISKCSHS